MLVGLWSHLSINHGSERASEHHIRSCDAVRRKRGGGTTQGHYRQITHAYRPANPVLFCSPQLRLVWYKEEPLLLIVPASPHLSTFPPLHSRNLVSAVRRPPPRRSKVSPPSAVSDFSTSSTHRSVC
jgi:hypothetical protein